MRGIRRAQALRGFQAAEAAAVSAKPSMSDCGVQPAKARQCRACKHSWLRQWLLQHPEFYLVPPLWHGARLSRSQVPQRGQELIYAASQLLSWISPQYPKCSQLSARW